MNEQSLAMEIIAEQKRTIEEQINFYENMRQELLTNAAKMEAKAESLRAYINGDEQDDVESKGLDRIIISEFSTDIVTNVIESVEDTYSDMLKSLVPKEKLDELDEAIAEYVIETCSAVFRQGFIRGIAAAKGGVV